MSGILVPFETREARTERLALIGSSESSTPPTPEERHRRYEQHTLTVCRQLLKYYKDSQRWNEASENEMAIAVTALKNICRLLAFTTPEVTT